MRASVLLPVVVASLIATSANASVLLLARGNLSTPGNTDLSGLAGQLENGLAANIFGGIGSGLAYAGGNTFYALPDRGPNATAYNAAIDNTTSYIARFHTLNLSLAASGPGSALPFTLTTALTRTTLFSSPSPLIYGTGAGLGFRIDGTTPIGSGAPSQNTEGRFFFTGRSDNYGAGGSGNPANARLDPESIRVSNDGKTVFISDEYGPYVRAFDRETGNLVRTYKLPDNLNVAEQRATETAELAANTSGRTTNKGMEGLAITPDGKTLVGIMQAPLIQDAANPATAKLVRIVTIDIATGETHEYGYTLTTGSGVSDIVAINNHQFLVDERDGKGLGDGSNAKIKQVFMIDLAGATEITGLNGAAAAAASVTKSNTPFVDLVAALVAHGVPKDQIPAKIEGMTFGQDVMENGQLFHTLYISNDNDFLPDVAGANQFFVFGFQDGDLPGFTPQQFVSGVPEPASWMTLIGGFGLVGGALRCRNRAGATPTLA